ncbi:GPI-anchored protein LLG1-like [Oryza brachyantha]|uniref:GPI-anchored protein LLG1-like domain-containing protein n=1 Tax=Oryza brachyantha TaxID=4533 RepID=J3MDH9_ORYBR|nr:GPI-anchored protein LLG1-like [Oryza brachyantha]
MVLKNFVFLFFLLLSPPILSDGMLQVMSGGSMIRRNLLQTKKDCPVNFGTQNYSGITSSCKSPWPPDLCCPPFTEFACNFTQYLNDGSNSCAETMFSYLNLIGGYPPDLFASECRGDKDGLPCNVSGSSDQTGSGGSSGAHGSMPEMCSLVMTLTVSGLGMMMLLLC